MKFDIALVSLSRERAYANYKASATYTFTVSNGRVKTYAEVILTDGSFEIIEKKGKMLRWRRNLRWRGFWAVGVTRSSFLYFSKFHTDKLNTSRSLVTSKSNSLCPELYFLALTEAEALPEPEK